jgi:GT2 family glycosyltransferase
LVLWRAPATVQAQDDVDFPIVDCNSELLACRRGDFLALGMFQDPTLGAGWPNWDDVDFGYRAHQHGFRLAGASRAVADHWDHSITSRATACGRYYQAGRSAVWLVKRHPELETLIPMLKDKTPVKWGYDAPGLAARKLVRRLMSSRPVVSAMTAAADALEASNPRPAVLRRLYNWLHGASLCQGFRDGLREFERRKPSPEAVPTYG